MYIYECMYVCMYVYVCIYYIYMYFCMYCICMNVCVCVYVFMYVYMCINMYMYAYMCSCMYVCVCVCRHCMYVCMYVYVMKYEPRSLAGKSEWRRVRISGTPIRPRREMNISLITRKGNSLFLTPPPLLLPLLILSSSPSLQWTVSNISHKPCNYNIHIYTYICTYIHKKTYGLYL